MNARSGGLAIITAGSSGYINVESGGTAWVSWPCTWVSWVVVVVADSVRRLRLPTRQKSRLAARRPFEPQLRRTFGLAIRLAQTLLSKPMPQLSWVRFSSCRSRRCMSVRRMLTQYFADIGARAAGMPDAEMSAYDGFTEIYPIGQANGATIYEAFAAHSGIPGRRAAMPRPTCGALMSACPGLNGKLLCVDTRMDLFSEFDFSYNATKPE